MAFELDIKTLTFMMTTKICSVENGTFGNFQFYIIFRLPSLPIHISDITFSTD